MKLPAIDASVTGQINFTETRGRMFDVTQSCDNSPSNRRALAYRSLNDSDVTSLIGESRYSMTRRSSVLISAVTAMPV